MVIGAWESRCGRRAVTGEWIVFKPRAGGSNYYLTLANHEEGDDVIAGRVALHRALDRALRFPSADVVQAREDHGHDADAPAIDGSGRRR